MNEKYKGIKVIGFDLDQTLYNKSHLIDDAIQEYIYYEISLLKDCSMENAKELFCKYYPKLSGSKSLEQIGFTRSAGKNIIQTALEKANILQFIDEDKDLIKLIFDIKKKYKSISLITGSNKVEAKKKLNKINLDVFDYEIFADTKGCSKSNGSSYEKWIFDFQKKDNTLKPENFLYIGDRSFTDVIIPEKYGIKSILVNIDKKDDSLDVDQLKDVKDIKELLL
ncbi:MAG: HAD family hydrolase [Nanoarchaeota archaeon]